MKDGLGFVAWAGYGAGASWCDVWQKLVGHFVNLIWWQEFYCCSCRWFLQTGNWGIVLFVWMEVFADTRFISMQANINQGRSSQWPGSTIHDVSTAVSTHYLLTIYTLSMHYLYTIYKLSTHSLHIIYIKSTNYLIPGSGSLMFSLQ